MDMGSADGRVRHQYELSPALPNGSRGYSVRKERGVITFRVAVQSGVSVDAHNLDPALIRHVCFCNLPAIHLLACRHAAPRTLSASTGSMITLWRCIPDAVMLLTAVYSGIVSDLACFGMLAASITRCPCLAPIIIFWLNGCSHLQGIRTLGGTYKTESGAAQAATILYDRIRAPSPAKHIAAPCALSAAGSAPGVKNHSVKASPGGGLRHICHEDEDDDDDDSKGASNGDDM